MRNELVNKEIYIDWQSVFSAVSKKWWAIAISLIIGSTLSYFLATKYIDKPVYKSQAIYVLSYSGGETITDMTMEYTFLSKILSNCVEIGKQNTFFNTIADKLNNGLSKSDENYIEAEELAECVTYEFNEKLGTAIYISANTGSADLSYRIIKVISEVFPDYVVSQYKLAGGNSMVFSLINTPELPDKPVNNTLSITYTALGGIAFAFLCIATFAFTALRDTRIKKEEDLMVKYNAPVLSTIPNFFDTEIGKGAYYSYETKRKGN